MPCDIGDRRVISFTSRDPLHCNRFRRVWLSDPVPTVSGMGHDLLTPSRSVAVDPAYLAELFAALEPGAPEGLLAEVSAPPAEHWVQSLGEARTQENLAVFRQLRSIAALVVAWRPTVMQREVDRRLGRRDTGADSLAEACVVSEVALELGLTEGSAQRRVDAALALVVDGRLPQAHLLAKAGVLDWARLNALVSRVRDLTIDGAQRVEHLVLNAKKLRLTIGRFEKAVDRAVLSVDAEAAERRRRAARSGRRVAFYRDDDGTDASASLWVSGPAEALAAVWASIDAGARHLRAAGDPRTLDQLRHDLVVTGCTRGGMPVPQAVLDEAMEAAGSAADGADDAGDPVAPEWFATPRPDVAAHITVTMTWETLVGLSQAPAELDGYGAIGADLARSLAVDGIWRCIAVDGEHGTVLGVGRTTYTPGYVPGRALREFTTVAEPECAVPWCHAKGEHCDLDHRVPHAHGGVTCQCNTQPLCRRHHRLKSAGYLRSERGLDHRHPPGTVVWTTRAGRRAVAFPHAPLPADAYSSAAASTSPVPATGRSERVAVQGEPVAVQAEPGAAAAELPDDAPPF